MISPTTSLSSSDSCVSSCSEFSVDVSSYRANQEENTSVCQENLSSMDPDGYVKVKCIATGVRSQSQLVKGLVFKKHAAHKHMPTKYKNPRLLLIKGVLGQSSSGLSSFDSMEQEQGYLKFVIEMLDLCHPNVVLVEKTVSRDIQESILAKGMTLVPSKTLMFIEGCPTRLGCTILLKGAQSDELKKINHSLQRDFLYFFGLGPMVAMFKYSLVTTYTVSVPPLKLPFSNSIRQGWLMKETQNVYMKVMLLFTEVANTLKKIRSQFDGLTLKLRGSFKEFSDIEDMLKQECSEFEVSIQNAVSKNGNSDQAAYKLLSLNRFAEDYFKYVNESFDNGNQTCLAKVLGIYQVVLKQTKSGKEMRHDLMVMENLTFGRNIVRQYDLKGALHARFNSAADGSGDVLLDQNFVNDMTSSPLYVSNNAKRILERAVWNDTTFLNSINVMDYSLLVGVDAERRELGRFF
ncbi:hypothetical protein L3X38_041999 [Prunus dulcis]|uniref:PIPK domain-containing protein n=1 Tax=Prunus dulcis TaxID=3755 RepID=A0AAD4UTR1_PRUDU|nr:hypothetical protein L3X38_041999 [Prunus dulcis]